MTEPHRIAESTFRRAAHGHHGKSVDVGRQAAPGPVTVACDLHIEITGETELDARRFLLALQSAVLDRGGSVTVTNGPVVKPQEGRKPRHLQ